MSNSFQSCLHLSNNPTLCTRGLCWHTWLGRFFHPQEISQDMHLVLMTNVLSGLRDWSLKHVESQGSKWSPGGVSLCSHNPPGIRAPSGTIDIMRVKVSAEGLEFSECLVTDSWCRRLVRLLSTYVQGDPIPSLFSSE